MAINKDADRSDIIIEGNTASWEINDIGAINGTYTGTFRFRCYLTPTQRLAASREYRELLGENPTLAAQHEDDLAFSLSQLKHRIISAPPFWTSTVQASGFAGDLPDENVIDKVLQAAIGAELKYRNQLEKKKTEVLEKAKKAAERLLESQQEDDAEEGDDDEGKS